MFAVHTNGTAFTNLYSFTAPAYDSSISANTNSDGAEPRAGLVLSGNTLYGTASFGGSKGVGTVFAVNTNGTGFTNLYNLSGQPLGGLVLWANKLYGTTVGGGYHYFGSVFAVSTNGTGYTNLYSFTTPAYDSSIAANTNSDGDEPMAGLILSGNTLYGTAWLGGSSGYGTVFAVNTDGTGFTNLHSFSALLNSTNSDGANPQAGLILSGNTLYGTAWLAAVLAMARCSPSTPMARVHEPLYVFGGRWRSSQWHIDVIRQHSLWDNQFRRRRRWRLVQGQYRWQWVHKFLQFHRR